VCTAQQDQRTAAMQWADYYADIYQVPRELVHSIIEVESGWHACAVSNKGAVGLMQLMPATAVTFGVTNRFEIEQNIRGGAAYLARLLKLFNGDLRLVAAAYLTGENRILPAGLAYSNAEVYQYVNKVARLYREKRLKRLPTEVLAQN
jgi:soluble lytic murein transglycosylase-like protein